MDREAVAPVKMKCQPGGMSFMPWKRGEVVKERRSMPQRVLVGRPRRRMAGVVIFSTCRGPDMMGHFALGDF